MNGDPIFPGFRKPTDDFRAVRDGRRAPLMWVDVDLSTARSIATATQLTLPIAANFLYVDQRAGTGFATAHFQDTNPGATPVTLFAGALWRVPFTKIAFENDAQAGSTLRLIYGLDVDALPISAAGVTVLNAVNINDQVSPSCAAFALGGALALGANQVTEFAAPSAHPRGFILRQFHQEVVSGAGGSITSAVIAAAAAPVNLSGGPGQIYIALASDSASARFVVDVHLAFRRFPASWGIWNVATVTTAAASGNSFFFSKEVL